MRGRRHHGLASWPLTGRAVTQWWCDEIVDGDNTGRRPKQEPTWRKKNKPAVIGLVSSPHQPTEKSLEMGFADVESVDALFEPVLWSGHMEIAHGHPAPVTGPTAREHTLASYQQV